MKTIKCISMTPTDFLSAKTILCAIFASTVNPLGPQWIVIVITFNNESNRTLGVRYFFKAVIFFRKSLEGFVLIT